MGGNACPLWVVGQQSGQHVTLKDIEIGVLLLCVLLCVSGEGVHSVKR